MSIQIKCMFPSDNRVFRIWNEGEIVKQSGLADLPEVLFEANTEAEADIYMDGFVDAVRIANGLENMMVSKEEIKYKIVEKG